MPVILECDIPEHWIPRPIHHAAGNLSISKWPTYKLRVLTPRSQVLIYTHVPPDGGSPYLWNAVYNVCELATGNWIEGYGSFTANGRIYNDHWHAWPYRFNRPNRVLIRTQQVDEFIEEDIVPLNDADPLDEEGVFQYTTVNGNSYYGRNVQVWAQPELWIRSDNVAEFLGTKGPGVPMDLSVLADWLQDRDGDSEPVTRLRDLLKSNTAGVY